MCFLRGEPRRKLSLSRRTLVSTASETERRRQRQREGGRGVSLREESLFLPPSSSSSSWPLSILPSPFFLFLSLADLSFGHITRSHDLRLGFKHPRTNKHRNTNSYCLSRPSSLSLSLHSVSPLSLFFPLPLSVFLSLCTVGGRQRKPHG